MISVVLGSDSFHANVPPKLYLVYLLADFVSLDLHWAPFNWDGRFDASRRMHVNFVAVFQLLCTFMWGKLLRLVLWIFLMILNQIPPEWYGAGRGGHGGHNQ